MAFLNVAPLWTGGQSGERHRLIVLLEIGDLIPRPKYYFLALRMGLETHAVAFWEIG